MNKKTIEIKDTNYQFAININELWYFKRLLELVKNFYNKEDNFNKIILLKIPGTGEFLKIQKNDFININEIINYEIESYKKNNFLKDRYEKTLLNLNL